MWPVSASEREAGCSNRSNWICPLMAHRQLEMRKTRRLGGLESHRPNCGECYWKRHPFLLAWLTKLIMSWLNHDTSSTIGGEFRASRGNLVGEGDPSGSPSSFIADFLVGCFAQIGAR